MVIYTSYTLLSGHLIDNCQEVAKGQPWKAIEVYKMDDSYAPWCLTKTRASPKLAILLVDFSITESQIVFALYSVKQVFLIIFPICIRVLCDQF